jgi:hypothetical protein
MSIEPIDPQVREEVEVTGSPHEAQSFLRQYSQMLGPWHLTAITDLPDGNIAIVGASFDNKNSGDMVKWVRERLGRANLYWQVNSLRRDLVPKAPKAALEDVAAIERLHVDIDCDPNAPGTFEDQRAAILALLQDEERLREAGLPGGPSFVIDSGGGYWAFWNLVEPFSLPSGDAQVRREAAHACGGYNKWLATTLNTAFGWHFGDKCHNTDRIARLPGTANIPNAKKREKGRKAAIAKLIVENPERLYRLDQFGTEDVGAAGASREAAAAIVIEKDYTPLLKGDAWEAIEELRRNYPEIGEKTIQKILLAEDIDENLDNLQVDSDKTRSGILHHVNRALQQSGVPLRLIIEILSDPRFEVSKALRFPVGRDKKVATREASRAEVLRAAEIQVRNVAADLREEQKKLEQLADAAAVLAPAPRAIPVEQPNEESALLPAQPSADAPVEFSSSFAPFPPGARLNDVFKEMNKRHCVLLQEGGKTRVLSWERTELDYSREVPVLQSFEDFRNRYMHQQIQVGKNKDGNPIQKPLGKYWLEHAARRQYLALRFQPGEGPVVDGYLNLWKGFAVEPKPGNWSLMREHIIAVLAEGNAEHADYIIKWAAWAIQNPAEPAEVALVFKGGRGTGKGTFARSLKHLFGQHGLQITSSNHLTGRFNSHLRDCCLLFADEALAPEDKKAESILKGLITEPEFTVEGKGLNAIQARNRLHIIMASNEEWVVPAGADERRFAIFTTAEGRKSKEYFTELYTQMSNGGLEAMLHDLQAVDLTDWHPRYNVPETKSLNDQKEQSLNPADQFFLNLLEEGRIPGAKMSPPDIVYSNDQLEGFGLYTIMRSASPKLRELSDQKLATILKRWGCSRVTNGSARGWGFPELPTLRTEWERRYGARQWDQIPKWDADIAEATVGEYLNGHSLAVPF